MGNRACVPAPASFSEPRTGSEKGAVSRLNVILMILVWPALSKSRTEGAAMSGLSRSPPFPAEGPRDEKPAIWGWVIGVEDRFPCSSLIGAAEPGPDVWPANPPHRVVGGNRLVGQRDDVATRVAAGSDGFAGSGGSA
jgi:hypothetical protein